MTNYSPRTETQPLLKHRNADFLVREVLVPRTCRAEEATHAYYLLSKSGYTTMEATRLVAEAFGILSNDVTYGGLKDEDGITDQLVALPLEAARRDGWERTDADRWLRLSRQGYGQHPLSIGGLEGNAFRIVVRQLDTAQAERLQEQRKLNFCFINYYDIQRFGVPGGVRRTHHVGAALLGSRWDDALRELVGLKSPESLAAAAWGGPAEGYFRSLDPRTPSFYLSAHGSGQWNAQLREIVREIGGTDVEEVAVEGIPFAYLQRNRYVRRLLDTTPDLAYRRYIFTDGDITVRESSRPTVIQTQLSFGEAVPDENHPGHSCIEVRFFLPSGCYATAALRQLFGTHDLL